MDPLSLYVILFFGALVMCAVAAAASRKPARACLACGEETPIDGRRCRHCGYELSRV